MRIPFDLRCCVSLAGALLLLGACGPVRSVTLGQGPAPHSHEVHGSAGHGPPPHAPAHGYRWKHRHAHQHHHAGAAEVELVFDSGLGVYVVVGLPSHYYWNGGFLRVEGGRWYASAQLDAGWSPVEERALPSGLRAKHAKTKKGGRQGMHPAKRR